LKTEISAFKGLSVLGKWNMYLPLFQEEHSGEDPDRRMGNCLYTYNNANNNKVILTVLSAIQVNYIMTTTTTTELLFRRVKLLRVYIADLTQEMLNTLQPRGHKTETTNWTSYL
jgi:hypothetical protein